MQNTNSNLKMQFYVEQQKKQDIKVVYHNYDDINALMSRN